MKICNTFIIINIISFLITGIDKLLAITNKRRISEKTLLTLAFLGGSIGTFISMFLFHHKTKKIKFKILIPLFIIMQIILLIYLTK